MRRVEKPETGLRAGAVGGPAPKITPEIPEDIPKGIEYISSAVGYIGAKPVKIKITVPENEKLGKVAIVIIDASKSVNEVFNQIKIEINKLL